MRSVVHCPELSTRVERISRHFDTAEPIVRGLPPKHVKLIITQQELDTDNNMNEILNWIMVAQTHTLLPHLYA